MRVGILFGGYSREREISFAGGRTVFDNLDRTLFEPVPIFVDSFGNFIEIDWTYIYKGSIRDFYPSAEYQAEFQIYAESLETQSSDEAKKLASHLGEPLSIEQLADKIDFAFLALHGNYGEDGQIQGVLESAGIPYSGSGILASAIGIDKSFQKKTMSLAGFDGPEYMSIDRSEWNDTEDYKNVFDQVKSKIGFPLVTRPAHQGSSIGVRMLMEENFDAFVDAVNAGFFQKELEMSEWLSMDAISKNKYVDELSDIRSDLGFPLFVDKTMVFHPKEFIPFIDNHFSNSASAAILKSVDTENRVIAEAFIDGSEFSCIVLRKEDGSSLALPPTEIIKGKEIYDYRSKYLPGLSRKVTPIDLDNDSIEKIRVECRRLFDFFEFGVYARIDGFILSDGRIFLNDPNTTSGMLPSSFFFHQAAEIGLNPSQFLTFLVRNSLAERIKTSQKGHNWTEDLKSLDLRINNLKTHKKPKKKIAVILGGYSSERHISVESGRNIYEKLASSEKYEPIPIFLTGSKDGYELHLIPINVLLKDNADDIRDKVENFKTIEILEKIKIEAFDISEKYTQGSNIDKPQKINLEQLAKEVDGVFIALHGRPGEDGHIQKDLKEVNLPFNGSSSETSQITINKFNTNQKLLDHDFSIAPQMLIFKENFLDAAEATYEFIESDFSYPFIAKPVDDGCSSAVKVIHNREELEAYAHLAFRDNEPLIAEWAMVLELKAKEEFPAMNTFLIEELVIGKEGEKFLEITGGMMTVPIESMGVMYEIFEPSEVLSSTQILSLEEKFLAGEGQNITPARFSDNKELNEEVSMIVRAELKRVAEVLNIEGYARIDAFVRIKENNDVETTIIEVNSLPGMTPATCIFHQCALNGYKPFDFIDNILEYSFSKQKQ